MKKYLFFLTLPLLLTLILLSCSGGNKTQPAENQNLTEDRSAPVGDLIDSHTHLGDAEGSETYPTKEMLAQFEKAHVKGAVVHLGGSNPDDYSFDLKKTNVKFAFCAGIKEKSTVQEVERGLQSKLFSCLKIYLGYVPMYAIDDFYKPFYALAEKYSVPVVFHTGDTLDKNASVKYANPLQIDEIALLYPKVTFVIAHVGNPWYHDAAEVAYKNANVYVDISAILIGHVGEMSFDVKNELVIRPLKWLFHYIEDPSKVLFGSDWGLVEIKDYADIVKQAIPKKHWNDVFYNSTIKVFKLDLPLK